MAPPSRTCLTPTLLLIMGVGVHAQKGTEASVRGQEAGGDTNLGESRCRKSLKLRAAGHGEGTGGSRVEPDTQQRQVSSLRLPTPGPEPCLALASHPAVRLNPPPSPLPGQSPTWQGGCTHLILSYSLVFPGAGNFPAPPPPLPRRNSEKLEGPGYSPPLPRLGAAGWSSWEEGTQESGIWSFEGMLWVQGPEPQKRGGGPRNKTGVGR